MELFDKKRVFFYKLLNCSIDNNLVSCLHAVCVCMCVCVCVCVCACVCACVCVCVCVYFDFCFLRVLKCGVFMCFRTQCYSATLSPIISFGSTFELRTLDRTHILVRTALSHIKYSPPSSIYPRLPGPERIERGGSVSSKKR